MNRMTPETAFETENVRLIHGDCLEAMRELPDSSVDLIVTSPPYNCRKDYGAVSDEMPWLDYYAFTRKWLCEAYRLLRRGGTIAVNVPPVIRWQRDHKYNDTWFGWDPTYKSHRGSEKTVGKARIEPLGFRIFDAMAAIDSHVREPIAWVKSSNGVDAFANETRAGCDCDPYMRPCYEWVLLGSKGQWFHRGGTGQRGKNALPDLSIYKDVWLLPSGRDRAHRAPFPVELPLRLIHIFTRNVSDVVCDPFMGIGTTGFACAKLGRKFIGIELSEEYCAVAKKRLER